MHRCELALEIVEPGLPLLPVRREPFVDRLQSLGADAVQATLRVGAHVDQAGVAQNAQVLRDRRLAEPERADEVADRTLRLLQEIKDAAAVGLAQGVEHRRRSGPGCRARREGDGGHAAHIRIWLYNCQAIKPPPPRPMKSETSGPARESEPNSGHPGSPPTADVRKDAGGRDVRIDEHDQDIRLANTRLVVGVARTYQGRGLELDALVDEGNAGLMRAVQQFDWRDGSAFRPYAASWIRLAIQHALDGVDAPTH
jgi:Sigma-70 region 2